MLGRTVLAERPGGKTVKVNIRELHVEGFFGAYDHASGHRIIIYPPEIAQVFDVEGSPLVQGAVVAPDAPEESASFDSLPLNGLFCSVCRAPQRQSRGGSTCANGHGGVEGVKDAHPF
jgi:hypothetical protein